jgi:hydrophobe/amphiphile efflux-3 (HAE3) family protein
MSAKQRLSRVVELSVRRPLITLLCCVIVAAGCAVVALGLSPSTGTGTLVSSGSADSVATATDSREFGGAAVDVLIRENLEDLVQSRDLGVVSELEACLDGQQVVTSTALSAFVRVPASRAQPYGGRSSPCGHLMRSRPAQVVYGPGTFLNQAVVAVNQRIDDLKNGAVSAIRTKYDDARTLALSQGATVKRADAAGNAAAELEEEQEESSLATLALDTGISTAPAIDNGQFMDAIVFDTTRGDYIPKARLSYLFPTPDSALIQVRLRSNLSSAQTAAAIGWIRAAVRMPIFHLGYHGSYLVSGEPVVLSALASTITSEVLLLLIAAVVVMAAVLLAVFRGGLRLLPLALALAAAAITFGLTALAGATLTIASIAVLPILIGLAVDYAIQFQSRAREAGLGDGGGAAAVAHAARAGAPTIAAAALATGTGFLVLLSSPVPMVRGFGLLLVVGVVVAFLLTLTAGSAVLVLAAPGADTVQRIPPAVSEAMRVVGASVRGAGELIADGARRLPLKISIPLRVEDAPPLGNVLKALTRNPGRVLAVGLALAVLGWVADTQTSVQSDITKLVPKNMPALRDLNTLEHVTGSSGEIDVLVHGRDVATPRTFDWMVNYETAMNKHFHYVEENGCHAATLCPALSLPTLFSSDSGTANNLSQASINSLLGSIPPYFSQAVITGNRQYAALAFGLRLMPLSRQEMVVQYMRTHLHPPPGTTASLAGLPVLAADADQSLSSSVRRLLTLLLGIVAVGAVLLALFRERRRALVPLVPIVFATGWSALIVFLLRIPLNPMSATLGALVIAISTEFSVLLSERFGQEREAGHLPAVALERAYRSTGAAVLASGTTAIAGFGVLVVSDITMLRDFGFVTLIDMSVSLAGVLAVLPAVLIAVEQGDVEVWRERVQSWFGALPRTAVNRLRRGPATAA